MVPRSPTNNDGNSGSDLSLAVMQEWFLYVLNMAPVAIDVGYW